MGHTLLTRVARLEDASEAGGGDGCPRCSGVLVQVRDIFGAFNSATWRGENLSEEELHEHETMQKCPQCGREISPDEGPEIGIGGSSSWSG